MLGSLRGSVGAAILSGLVTGCLFPDYTFDEPEPSGGAGAQGGGGTTSSGGGGAGPGGGGAQPGGGGAGGGPPQEDCLAPGDEDSDGMADCADPDCDPDVECVATIPVGWGTFGYVALSRGAQGADPPCPLGAETSAYAGNGSLMNTTASCTACDCDTPMDRDCEILDLNSGVAGVQGVRVRDASCAGSPMNFDDLTVPVGWDGSCTGSDQAVGGGMCPGTSCNLSVQVPIAQPTNGSCLATGGEPSGLTPAWGESVKACSAAETLGGCGAGETCVPRPASPYEPRACIGRAGDHACPSGAFSQKSLAFASFTDDRDCSSCSCGAPAGGTCKLLVSLFSNAAPNTCTTLLTTLESNSCVNLAGNPALVGSRSATVMNAPTGGSCPVTGGGVPSGGVTPTSPTTFCCLPPD